MIHKQKEFTSLTMPNWFMDVVTRCIENTDEILLRKFIVESERTSKLSYPSETKFNELFKELASNFGNENQTVKQEVSNGMEYKPLV